MDVQVERAVQIAWDPKSDNKLKGEAFVFLTNLRADPSAWEPCLTLFARNDPPLSEVVRHFALEIISTTVANPELDIRQRIYIRNSLLSYVRQNYGTGAQEKEDSPHIQNKLAQVLTSLFVYLYDCGWETFFDDFRELAGDANAIGIAHLSATTLYLRILISVHDEIADTLLSRPDGHQKRNVELKDLVRARDVQKIALSWQEILAKWRQTELGMIEMCLKTVSRWVSWIDIGLVVNEPVINMLLEIAGQQAVGASDSAQTTTRNAAIDTFTEIVGKKMKPPEKIELISFLNLGTIVSQIIASPGLSEAYKTLAYDIDLAEVVAKLVDNVVSDIVRILDTEGVDDQVKQRADGLLQQFLPSLLRLFGDEFDDVCTAVIPALTDMLTYIRKFVIKLKIPCPPQYHQLLSPILDAIIEKMRYDESLSWKEEGVEVEEADFEELRRRLYVLQQTVAQIDEDMYLNTVSRVVFDAFNTYAANPKTQDWRAIELALHQMYLFGELAVKNGGLYSKRKPSSLASQRLVEMMHKMIETDVAKYWQSAVKYNYMEIVVRYVQYFEQNTNLIQPVLENFFTEFLKEYHDTVRLRSYYLLLKFVRPLKTHLAGVSQALIESIGGLLTIKAEVPKKGSGDDSTDDGTEGSADAEFDAQLYLFEAVGCIASAPSLPVESKTIYAQSVIQPLFANMEQNLEPAKSGDERAILQLHHDIMALGTLARGFTDWMPGATSGAPPPSEVSEQFVPASEAILLALVSLNASTNIRTASRFALSRLLGVLGTRVLQQLPRWIEGLLSPRAGNDELSVFLRLLDQIVFAFKGDITGVLDTLLGPLLQRVFAGLQKTIEGFNDTIQVEELKREFLGFLLILLNNDIASVLVSSTNQQLFETIMNLLDYYARDINDLPNARLSLFVLARMTTAWGGPDLPMPSSGSNTATAKPATSLAQNGPALPGFQDFALGRFVPLSWALPGTAGFKIRDPHGKSVIAEIALLQVEMLKKFGDVMVAKLRGDLSGMGVGEGDVNAYVARLVEATKGHTEMKAFREYLGKFLEGAGAGS